MYKAWLTTAVKADDLAKQSPPDLEPMIVLVEDKQNDIKQQFFYDRVPVGGRIPVFGSAAKFDENPMKLPREKRDEAVALLATREPQQLVTQKADNYHRRFGVNWAFIEKGGATLAREWTTAKEERLKKFVDYGHRLGYLVSFHCLDGYSDSEYQGWDKDYNFGSQDAARIRWNAAIRAHADLISTDQYETLAGLIRTRR